MRRLHGKEPFTLHRQIQRIPRSRQGPLPEIDPVSTQDPEVVHRLPNLRATGPAVLQAPRQHPAKIIPLRPKSARPRIRQVVRRRIQSLRPCQKSAVSCVESAIHATEKSSSVATPRNHPVRAA